MTVNDFYPNLQIIDEMVELHIFSLFFIYGLHLMFLPDNWLFKIIIAFYSSSVTIIAIIASYPCFCIITNLLVSLVHCIPFLIFFIKKYRCESKPYKITYTYRKNNEGDCTICLEKLNEQTIIKLSCLHKYHKNCYHKWINIKDNCPLCRTNECVIEEQIMMNDI